MGIGLWAQVAVYILMYISLDVDWDRFVFG